MKKITYTLLLLIFTYNAFAQKAKVDSLHQALKTAKQDTNKVKALILLSRYVGWRVGNFDSALYYAKKALVLSQKLKYKKGQAMAHNNFAISYGIQGDYDKALKEYLPSVVLQKEINDKKGLANTYNNIGLTYYYQGNYPEGLKMLLRSLKIRKDIGYKKGIAASYCNIANIYIAQQDYPKALKNYLFAFQMQQTLSDKLGLAISANNIGICYFNLHQYAKSLKFYSVALKIYNELGDKRGIAQCHGNIGMIYDGKEAYTKALEQYNFALEIQKKLGLKSEISISYNMIGKIKLRLNRYSEAKEMFNKSLTLAKQIGSKENIEMSYNSLYQLDSALGNYKLAYENYKMYIIYRDSLKNKENTKKITQLQMQFKFDQKQAADSIAHAKEREIQQAKIAKQNAVIKAKQEQQYALFGGLALLLAFAGFMYNRFKKTQKQKKIIEKQKAETEHQKQLLETKNKEISDSINYAKRIQESTLPSRFSLSENLKSSFVLFKPKDIVSGDFYWLEKVGGSTFFAAADCTGHGVPGAMVSVVCANALSKALLEENITETGKLLDRTREIVIQQFSHSDENVKDGMDISLCKLTPSENGGWLQWSGANNPLWIINPNRKTWFKEALTFGEGVGGAEVKPDKQPIGKTETPKPFKTHNIELQQGDSIYIFSDGYADQFGGADGKKFKYKPLKDLLISLQDKSMDKQKEAIDKIFMEWKGEEEQVDDVCVIGVRV